MKDMAFAVFLALVIGMAGGFYWFFYRPAQARSECEKVAIEQAKLTWDDLAFGGKKPGPATAPKELKGMYSVDQKNASFISCMRQHGLEG